MVISVRQQELINFAIILKYFAYDANFKRYVSGENDSFKKSPTTLIYNADCRFNTTTLGHYSNRLEKCWELNTPAITSVSLFVNDQYYKANTFHVQDESTIKTIEERPVDKYFKKKLLKLCLKYNEI